MLDQTYGVDSNMGLSYQLTHIAQQQATVYWQDHRQEILRIVDGSFLEEYDEINVGMSFRRAASASIGYTLHVRCGLDAHSVFIPEDFTNVFDWNTPDAVGTLTALGMTIFGKFSGIFAGTTANLGGDLLQGSFAVALFVLGVIVAVQGVKKLFGKETAAEAVQG